MNTEFDANKFIEEAATSLRDGKPLSGENGVLAPMIKKIIEKALESEFEEHMNHERNSRTTDGNYRNGTTKKTVKSQYGGIEIETPRDRKGDFEPQIVKKRQIFLNDEIAGKIMSLYGLGMSYNDIQNHIKELYMVDIPPSTMTSITNKILPEIQEWQNRPLDSVYPFIYMDAIHYKIREDNKVVSKAVYIVLGINQDGKKEILGFYLNETEGAKFWLQILTDLSNRGVNDILIACIDNLKGFSEAIESIYPNTDIQLCVIHQVRNSMKYVSYKDSKEVLSDLKKIYKALTLDSATKNLEEFSKKWSKKYPIVVKSWNSNWDHLSSYFKYPDEIRKKIYTTNIIESVNRQLRKATKTKGSFTSEDALKKLLFLTINNISSKWSQPFSHWSLTISQLSIFFEGRLDLDLKY